VGGAGGEGADQVDLIDLDWDELYAQVIAATGWTWAEAGRLTLPRFRALSDHWSRHPPVQRLLAAWLGVESDDKPKSKTKAKKEDFDQFFKELTGQMPPP